MQGRTAIHKHCTKVYESRKVAELAWGSLVGINWNTWNSGGNTWFGAICAKASEIHGAQVKLPDLVQFGQNPSDIHELDCVTRKQWCVCSSHCQAMLISLALFQSGARHPNVTQNPGMETPTRPAPALIHLFALGAITHLLNEGHTEWWPNGQISPGSQLSSAICSYLKHEPYRHGIIHTKTSVPSIQSPCLLKRTRIKKNGWLTFLVRISCCCAKRV